MKGWMILACLGAAVLAGCGSDTQAQISSGASSSSSGAGGEGGQGGTATGSGGAGGQGGMATGSGGQGGMATGSGGAGGQAGGASSSSSGGGAGMIACGASMCDAATQKCCATMAGQTCIDVGAACQGLSLDCTSAANCAAGEVCCLVFGGPGSAPTASCAAQCGGGGPGGGQQLCSTDAECPMGMTCKTGQIPGGFMSCSF